MGSVKLSNCSAAHLLFAGRLYDGLADLRRDIRYVLTAKLQLFVGIDEESIKRRPLNSYVGFKGPTIVVVALKSLSIRPVVVSSEKTSIFLNPILARISKALSLLHLSSYTKRYEELRPNT